MVEKREEMCTIVSSSIGDKKIAFAQCWRISQVRVALIGIAIALSMWITPCIASELELAKQEHICHTDFCQPPFTKSGIEFQATIKERIERNLPSGVVIPQKAMARFFVLPDGFIRDVSIVSPSTLTADLECLDAVYCASPLPTPPIFRTAPAPAPASRLVNPASLGAGVYTFSFSPTAPGQDSVPEFVYYKIPKEVLYRYPGLFSKAELDSPSNKKSIPDMTTERLEYLRYQWATFYRDNAKATREQILQWSHEIDAEKEKQPGFPGPLPKPLS